MPARGMDHSSATIVAAETPAQSRSTRHARFCQGSAAKGCHTRRMAMGKAAAPEYCSACAAKTQRAASGTPAARNRTRARPPALQKTPDNAKWMLARGVPGSRAARSVSTSSTAVISSEVVKWIRSLVRPLPVVTVACNPLRIAAAGHARPASRRGRGKMRGVRPGKHAGADYWREAAGGDCDESRLRTRVTQVRVADYASTGMVNAAPSARIYLAVPSKCQQRA
jgi:hypothetical protein